MRFRILGPIRVDLGGREVAVTASRERILLAVLLLHANQPVTTEQLIDAIWAGSPPRNALNQLQGCVSRIRKRLGDGGQVIVTEPAGYQAVVEPAELDLLEFRRLVGEARAAAGDGRPGEAGAGYRAALALWRGPALAGLVPIAAILDEERAQALEECLDRELAAGAGGELVAELTDRVRQHPHREGLHRALMLALYRAGRQADALAAYRHAHRLFRDELGTEPGSELQELHQAILNRNPALAAPPPAASQPVLVPRQLPSDVAGFTGRADALKALDELLAGRPESTGPVVISAIAGTAGVGKTALAVHWAHRVVDRFPDGQMYVNLRGFDPGGTPMDLATAVRGFLETLQVPPERVPTSVDAQVNLYRSLLADRRMLVVLDNARDADQVRPLLPGAPGCLALVTSRYQLSGLVATDGAVPLPIDLLPDHESRQLLAARLGGERLAGEPEAVADLVTACAGLPLALAIVAARATARPGFPLAAVSREVREAGVGLEPWAGPDAATDLRAVFSWSYEALDPEAARLFRLLGLHPGPDLAAPAAASLAGIPLPQARRLLAALTEANLVIEHVPGRYAFHDLLRAYVTVLVGTVDSEPDRHAARHRMLDHYLHTADAAVLLFDPPRRALRTLVAARPGVTSVDLQTHRQAVGWLTTEQPVLVRTVEHAATNGFHVHTWQLASCIGNYLSRRGDHHQALATQLAALRAAQRLANRSAEALAEVGIGNAYAWLGSHDNARLHLERALNLRRELGDQYWQAYSHYNLAWLAEREGHYREALRGVRQAYELFQTVEDRAGQARALNSIAWCYSLLGDYRQAIAHGERALAIYRRIGDTAELGSTWDSLGYAHHHLGDHRRAIACYRRALAVFERREYRPGRAMTLHHLGDANYALGQPDAARSAWRTALYLLRELNHPEADEVSAKLDRLACEQ